MSTQEYSSSNTRYPYPNCWQDDSRVQVLLAPFRERSVNPENYDSKMKFWQDTIKEYCLFKGKPNFCKQELQQIYTKGQRVPCCLDSVIQEMQRQKLVRLRKEFEYDPENSWTGWAVNSLLKKPLYWGFNKIKTQLGAHDPAKTGLVEFVHLEVIRVSAAVLKFIKILIFTCICFRNIVENYRNCYSSHPTLGPCITTKVCNLSYVKSQKYQKNAFVFVFTPYFVNVKLAWNTRTPRMVCTFICLKYHVS